MKDRETDRFRGYCYVEFDELSELERVLDLNGVLEVEGHIIKIDIAEGKKDRGGGGGFDRSRGRGGFRGGRGSSGGDRGDDFGVNVVTESTVVVGEVATLQTLESTVVVTVTLKKVTVVAIWETENGLEEAQGEDGVATLERGPGQNPEIENHFQKTLRNHQVFSVHFTLVQSECRVALLTHWISLDPLANLGVQVPASLAGFYCEQISIPATDFTIARAPDENGNVPMPSTSSTSTDQTYRPPDLMD
uniref:RRM domain-containing protein n=1 Tax=Timema monikensis TaxID=170555 RepID=A0A7R9HQH5_9NEOP|nr:unnamed protein product [Timema monikensis]